MSDSPDLVLVKHKTLKGTLFELYDDGERTKEFVDEKKRFVDLIPESNPKKMEIDLCSDGRMSELTRIQQMDDDTLRIEIERFGLNEKGLNDIVCDISNMYTIADKQTLVQEKYMSVDLKSLPVVDPFQISEDKIKRVKTKFGLE